MWHVIVIYVCKETEWDLFVELTEVEEDKENLDNADENHVLIFKFGY